MPERVSHTTEPCSATIDLQNKEQILSCIEQILSDEYHVIDKKRRKHYEDLRLAIENNTLRATLSLDAQTKQMSCIYTARINGEEVDIFSCTWLLQDKKWWPFGAYAFNDLEAVFGDCRNHLDWLFSCLSSWRRYPTAIPRESILRQLQWAIQSGCIYALYDNLILRTHIHGYHSWHEQVIASTVSELRDLFNKQPSLEGAYQWWWSWYYKYGVQETWPYRRAVENEQLLAEQVQHVINPHVVSLWCGTNDELEKKIVQATLRRHELLISLSPVFLTVCVDLVLRLCNQSTAGIEKFYWLSGLITIALAKILPHVTKKWTYMWIDTDATSTAYIRQKLQESQQRREVFSLTKDLFSFLAGDNDDIDIPWPKTFSIPWGTFGNFDVSERNRLAKLLNKNMDVWDNVYIPYFVQAADAVKKKQHTDLYDNPYGNVWVTEYLHALWFPVGSFVLETRYVTEEKMPFSSAIQIVLCVKQDVLLSWKTSKRLYKAWSEEIIHSSLRTSSTNILNDFPPHFVIQKEVVSEDGLQWAVVLKKVR